MYTESRETVSWAKNDDLHRTDIPNNGHVMNMLGTTEWKTKQTMVPVKARVVSSVSHDFQHSTSDSAYHVMCAKQNLQHCFAWCMSATAQFVGPRHTNFRCRFMSLQNLRTTMILEATCWKIHGLSAKRHVHLAPSHDGLSHRLCCHAMCAGIAKHFIYMYKHTGTLVASLAVRPRCFFCSRNAFN